MYNITDHERHYNFLVAWGKQPSHSIAATAGICSTEGNRRIHHPGLINTHSFLFTSSSHHLGLSHCVPQGSVSVHSLSTFPGEALPTPPQAPVVKGWWISHISPPCPAPLSLGYDFSSFHVSTRTSHIFSIPTQNLTSCLQPSLLTSSK